MRLSGNASNGIVRFARALHISRALADIVSLTPPGLNPSPREPGVEPTASNLVLVETEVGDLIGDGTDDSRPGGELLGAGLGEVSPSSGNESERGFGGCRRDHRVEVPALSVLRPERSVDRAREAWIGVLHGQVTL